jgi:hypothetical protein
MPLHHSLIVFDLDAQVLAEPVRAFNDGQEAAQAYAELEARHRRQRNLEIVLVWADSLDAIKRTHANYFGVAPTSPYLAGVR